MDSTKQCYSCKLKSSPYATLRFKYYYNTLFSEVNYCAYCFQYYLDINCYLCRNKLTSDKTVIKIIGLLVSRLFCDETCYTMYELKAR